VIRTIPDLSGPLILEPAVHRDARGFFLETFRLDALPKLGIHETFVQDNHSRSVRGTVRGLHFQVGEGQAKLIRVARGAIWDVFVDLRTSSATVGRWGAVALNDVDHRALYLPVGFAHGFCVVSDVADVLYRVSSYYDPELERGLAWDDPALAIPWPAPIPVLSDRDRGNPGLREVLSDLTLRPES
jgi:dTDP-4-dehydrorhamnose 3,5-epimerase